MDPEVQRRGDDEQAARLEDAEDLVERPADLEDVLERLDAEDGPGRRVGQADRADVLDAIDARARAACRSRRNALPGNSAAEVGVIDLALDLVRAELVDRAGTVERLGHQAAERLVVVAHRAALLLEPMPWSLVDVTEPDVLPGPRPSERRILGQDGEKRIRAEFAAAVDDLPAPNAGSTRRRPGPATSIGSREAQLAAVALDAVIERVALDGDAAGLGDQAADLGDGHLLRRLGAGLVVDLLVDDRAVDVVGAEARATWAVLMPSMTQ